MAKLYKVLSGSSKEKATKVLMVDTWKKCSNYVNQRKSQKAKDHFNIVEAEDGESKKARRKIKGGYITGGIFNAHT